jgi:hypothetical protein
VICLKVRELMASRLVGHPRRRAKVVERSHPRVERNNMADEKEGGTLSTEHKSGSVAEKASVTAEVKSSSSSKSGQDSASASAGFDQKASASAQTHYKDAYGGISATEQTGASEHADGSIGVQGVKASGGVDVGSDVSIGVKGGVKGEDGSVSGGTSATVGDHLAASFSGQLTSKDHVVTLHVGGQLAAVIGIKGHVTVKIDEKPIINAVDDTGDELKKIFDIG